MSRPLSSHVSAIRIRAALPLVLCLIGVVAGEEFRGNATNCPAWCQASANNHFHSYWVGRNCKISKENCTKKGFAVDGWHQLCNWNSCVECVECYIPPPPPSPPPCPVGPLPPSPSDPPSPLPPPRPSLPPPLPPLPSLPPLLPPPPPRSPPPPPHIPGCAETVEHLYDEFTHHDDDIWEYAHRDYVSQFAPLWYLQNMSRVDEELSLGEGRGLQIYISAEPCAHDSLYGMHVKLDGKGRVCHGAEMASGHLTTQRLHGFGDYEARLRAPRTLDGDGSDCHPDVFGYFTAGFVNSQCGWWNEVNIAFHPDRDRNGTRLHLELQGDTGGYQQSNADLADYGLDFNFREAFHTYRMKVRPCSVSWWVDGVLVHVTERCLSQPMHTSIILRNNKPGIKPTSVMEVAWFRFTPFEPSPSDPVPPPKGTSQQELIKWYTAHPDY